MAKVINNTSGITNVVQVITAGPTGPQGPQGTQGPQGLQGPSGSATGVGVEVFNAYTSSVNSSLSGKATLASSNTFSGGTIQTFETAKAKIFTGVTSNTITANANDVTTLLSVDYTIYPVVILDVYAQNESVPNKYGIQTVYISAINNGVKVNRTEYIGGPGNVSNETVTNLEFTGSFPGAGTTVNITVQNKSNSDNYNIKYVARAIS